MQPAEMKRYILKRAVRQLALSLQRCDGIVSVQCDGLVDPLSFV